MHLAQISLFAWSSTKTQPILGFTTFLANRPWLGVHGTEVARKSKGLEAAVADHSLVQVAALHPGDSRSVDVLVAGAAALLVAKDRDRLDILRLLRFSEMTHLATTLNRLATNPIASETTREARVFLQDLFADQKAVGTQMAVRASAGLEDEITIAMSCELLAKHLPEVWKSLAATN